MKIGKLMFGKDKWIVILLAAISSLGGFYFSVSNPAGAQSMVTVDIGVQPSTISCGGSATLSWASSNASNVTISGVGNVSSSGSMDVSPNSTTSYTIQATNSDGGDGSASVTLNVESCTTQPQPTYSYQSPYDYQSPQSYPTPTSTYSYQSPYDYQSPSTYSYQTPSTYSYQTPAGNNVTVNLTADDTRIDEGDSTILRWTSTNATSCTASGGTNGWSGTRSTSGSFNTGDLDEDETYRIRCQNNSSSADDDVTIRVDEDDDDDDEGPEVETRSATNIDFTSATLNGRVDGNGRNTRVWFEYSDDRNDIDEQETNEDSVGSGTTSFSERVTGLQSNTIYYFRAVAENSEGDDRGSIFSFRTSGVSYISPYSTPSVYSYQTPASVSRPPSGSALILVNSSVDRHQPIIPSLDNTCPLPGDEIGYTLRYQNVGNRAVTSATVQLNLPLEVDYLYSDPNNPSRFGNTLIFNLGTISAGEEGTIMVRVRVKENVRNGTILNFPATLTYIDPSGDPRSVSVNVTAEVGCQRDVVALNLDANTSIFGTGFFPSTVLGWLLLLLLILILAYLARQVFQRTPPTVIVDRHPPLV